MASLPCFYYPTTAILIDDDIDFLDSLRLALAPYCKTVAFHSPAAAQQHINSHKLNPGNYFSVSYESFSEFHVEVAIEKIAHILTNPLRFTQNTVVIIDYDMPIMNGLKLARSIKAQSGLKIIMLTGEADQSTAVNAFNKKEIDGFILKSAPQYLEQLKLHFALLQQEYFSEISRGIVATLSSKSVHPLLDNAFIELFHGLCAKYNIVEYYLLDESGSFLMLDADARATWLVVRSEEDIQFFYELATEELNPKDARLPLLRNGEKIVFLPLGASLLSIKDWLILDAKPLHPKVFYSIFQGPQGFYKAPKILSYKAFFLLD